MTTSQCLHCGHRVDAKETHCPYCGMPLPPGYARQQQKRFILWFVVLVLFCGMMIMLLPPDWTRFMDDF